MNAKSWTISKILKLVAVLVFGFGAIYSMSNLLEAKRPKLPESIEDSDLAFQGERLKKASLGFNGLLADWYWMSALQYIGGKIVRSKEKLNIDDLKNLNPKQLYSILDTATTLDPKFTTAYSYGAIVLPAIDQDQAIKFIEKGIKDNPDQWRLYQHLGFIYWKKNDFKKAAENYAKGAHIEGAPPFLREMSARLEAEGGSRDVARQIYTEMYDTGEDEQTKNLAASRLLQVESFEERDAIRAVLKNFETKNGRCANDWDEIFTELKTIRLQPNNRSFRFRGTSPLDPTESPYKLLSEKCDVDLDLTTSKIPYR